MKSKISPCLLLISCILLSCTVKNNKETKTEISNNVEVQAKKMHTNNQYVYKISTRGYHKTVEIKDGFILEGESKNEMSSEENTKIEVLTKALNLDNIQNWKAPSQDRFVDAAMSAILIIKTPDATFKSVEFDHDNPPLELKELVNLIVTKAQKSKLIQ